MTPEEQEEMYPDRYVFGPVIDLRTLRDDERAQPDPPHGWVIYRMEPR